MKINFDYLSFLQEGAIIKRCVAGIKKSEKKSNRVLLIAPSFIGDFTAGIPAITDFVNRNKHYSYELVVTDLVKPLAEKIVGIKRVYASHTIVHRDEEGYTTPNRVLPNGNYHEVIVLRASRDVFENIVPRISAQKVSSRLKENTIFSLNSIKSNFLRQKPIQVWDFSFQLLNGTPRIIPVKNILQITQSDKQKIHALKVLSKNRINMIIHTGASWPMMNWPLDRWVTLLNNLSKNGNYNFIFVGAEKDKLDYKYISSKLIKKPKSVIGTTNTFELAVLLSMSDIFVGIDSGPGNIAHLVGLRSLIIYGPGPHNFLSPYKEDEIIDKSNGKGFYQRYFTKKEGFIHQIYPDEVYEKIQSMI